LGLFPSPFLITVLLKIRTCNTPISGIGMQISGIALAFARNLKPYSSSVFLPKNWLDGKRQISQFDQFLMFF